jgi:hypothetical protein
MANSDIAEQYKCLADATQVHQCGYDGINNTNPSGAEIASAYALISIADSLRSIDEKMARLDILLAGFAINPTSAAP